MSKNRKLRDTLDHVAASCTDCGACVTECRFLGQRGTPKKIVEALDPASREHHGMSFECSLCGLCSAVCPTGINPAAMFLEMRRSALRPDSADLPEYGRLLGYEQRGTSRRYTWYSLPAGCNTVFFPGCALAGTRPRQTLKLFETLGGIIPDLGIVLDCCTKPSHSLGRQEFFNAMFGELNEYLVGQGVKTVLVACPNCREVFDQHATKLTVRTVYEVLAESGQLAETLSTRAEVVTVHDPCVSRFAESVQAAARTLITRTGLTIREMQHSGSSTICCGEGGAVACLTPELADEWGRRRQIEAGGLRIVTYCAGCTQRLSRHTPTSHVIDLLFDPDTALAGNARVSRAPFTYLNRLKLKKHLQKSMPAATTRERTFTAGEKKKRGIVKPLVIASFLAAIILAIRLTGVSQYLEQEKLRSIIESHGALAPVLYMLVYAIAPSLFMPGLPITIVGGILFGPFWGVVYTIIGATAGACIAFLLARSIAQSWVKGKLTGPRWKKLDSEVEKHGWKVVAFTRLVPLFPFNLLNYAFGLTSVRFSHYALATFICMLPACIAFIVFSSSLVDLLKGKISPPFLVGLALVIVVSIIPGFYRRYQQKRARCGKANDRIPE